MIYFIDIFSGASPIKGKICSLHCDDQKVHWKSNRQSIHWKNSEHDGRVFVHGIIKWKSRNKIQTYTLSNIKKYIYINAKLKYCCYVNQLYIKTTSHKMMKLVHQCRQRLKHISPSFVLYKAEGLYVVYYKK